jgi:hypothetical protein
MRGKGRSSKGCITVYTASSILQVHYSLCESPVAGYRIFTVSGNNQERKLKTKVAWLILPSSITLRCHTQELSKTSSFHPLVSKLCNVVIARET